MAEFYERVHTWVLKRKVETLDDHCAALELYSGDPSVPVEEPIWIISRETHNRFSFQRLNRQKKCLRDDKCRLIKPSPKSGNRAWEKKSRRSKCKKGKKTTHVNQPQAILKFQYLIDFWKHESKNMTKVLLCMVHTCVCRKGFRLKIQSSSWGVQTEIQTLKAWTKCQHSI